MRHFITILCHREYVNTTHFVEMHLNTLNVKEFEIIYCCSHKKIHLSYKILYYCSLSIDIIQFIRAYSCSNVWNLSIDAIGNGGSVFNFFLFIYFK